MKSSDWMFETSFVPKVGRRSVVVRLWPPAEQKGGVWSCRVQILGVGRGVKHECFGLGPLQCLAISLEYTRKAIEATGLDYHYHGASFRELLPLTAPTQYGPEMLDEVEGYIEEKIRIEEQARSTKRSRKTGEP